MRSFSFSHTGVLSSLLGVMPLGMHLLSCRQESCSELAFLKAGSFPKLSNACCDKLLFRGTGNRKNKVKKPIFI